MLVKKCVNVVIVGNVDREAQQIIAIDIVNTHIIKTCESINIHDGETAIPTILSSKTVSAVIQGAVGCPCDEW